jgi:hypothetical protein
MNATLTTASAAAGNTAKRAAERVHRRGSGDASSPITGIDPFAVAAAAVTLTGVPLASELDDEVSALEGRVTTGVGDADSDEGPMLARRPGRKLATKGRRLTKEEVPAPRDNRSRDVGRLE